jgi:hypothetical protein
MAAPALPDVVRSSSCVREEKEEELQPYHFHRQPTTDNRQPTTDNRPLPHADGDKSAGHGGPALPGVLNSGGRDDHPP